MDFETDAVEARDERIEETPHGWRETGAHAVIQEERGEVDAFGMQGEGNATCLQNGRVDCERKENKSQGVALLNTSGASDGLGGNAVSTGEKRAIVQITAVDQGSDCGQDDTNYPEAGHHK